MKIDEYDQDEYPEEVEINPAREAFWEVCLLVLVLLNLAVWPVLAR
jgi:hypothetical protein